MTTTQNTPTPLSDDEFIELCASGTLEEITRALADGATPNARNCERGTALMDAARDNSLAVVRALLEAGTWLNPHQDGRGEAGDLSSRGRRHARQGGGTMIDDPRRLMASRKDDEQYSPREREIRRNCGRLLGGLDNLLPCIYLAGVVSDGEMRGRNPDAEQGFFAVGGGADSGGGVSHLGLLLPVSLCRHERTRATLMKIPSFLADTANASGEDQLRLVDDSLREAFDSDLYLTSDRVTVDRFWPHAVIELKPTDALFRRLHEAFDYVAEIADNPSGLVRVTNTAPFPWKSYVDLLKWRNRHLAHRFGRWTSLLPLLLCGDTEELPSHMRVTEWREGDGLERPDENPAERFALRPGLPDARPFVRLDKNEAGWSELHLGLDEASTEIRLSHVFDPFPDLVCWAEAIDEGDLPVEIRIDEEGSIVVLTVAATNDPGRMLLRVRCSYQDTSLLEGIVARAALAGALKEELRRFFTQDFDTREWDDGEDRKALVLAHPWLASGD